jgi:ribulose-phosphate 3-epimerase
MPVICPSILADTPEQYHTQIEKVGHFAERIQIDLTDGRFAKKQTIKPQDAWWPVGLQADFHLMYFRPDSAVDTILQHKPNMIIVHAESDGNFASFSEICHKHGVKIGVAVLPKSSLDSIISALPRIDHVLIFSGELGSFGGHADLDLLNRVHVLKQHKPGLEVGWDGGINDQNISRLATAGVDVFDVGGYIQNSPDPEHAYKVLERIAVETGTT